MNKLFVYSRNYFIRYVVLLAIMFVTAMPKANAITVPFGNPEDWERFDDFSEYMSSSPKKNVAMKLGENLTYEGVADGSYYKIGFLDASGAVVGHAKNRYPTAPGGEGWIDGDYSSDLGDGNKPTYMIIGRDIDNDGLWRHIPTSSVYGDEGDLVVTNNNIWLGNIGDSQEDFVQGDMGKLPYFVTAGNIENFGPMDIRMAVVPEPGTLLLLGSGLIGLMRLIRKKQGILSLEI